MVEAEWAQIDHASVDVPQSEIDRIRAYFRPPPFADRPAMSKPLEEARQHDPRFDRWVRVNTAPHRVDGYVIANISLKPKGGTPGDITADQMDAAAALAARYSFDEIRATHEQNLCLPHVLSDELYDVFQALDEAGLAHANIGLASDIIACPGLDYCSLANARSIPIAQRLSEKFSDHELADALGEMKIKISGCINACGHHHVGHIGILGVDKKGEEFYQILLGGDGSENASIGEITGRGFSASEVVDAVERLARYFLSARQAGERFIDTYRRLGQQPFKEVLYGDPALN
ncbi:MAG: nitrite/sulfite reductase [Parvularculaceae bacterium]